MNEVQELKDLYELKRRYKKLADLFPNDPDYKKYYRNVSKTIKNKLVDA